MHLNHKSTCVEVVGAVIASLAIVSSTSAVNTVGGIIGSDTHWMAGTGPFIVDQSILVTNNATLTIDPGVEVRFKPNRGIVVNAGQLIARGTDTNKITFTADVDNTDRIRNAERWRFIQFADGAADATFDAGGNYTGGSIIEHAIVEGAGHDERGAVHATRASPFVSQSLIRGNAGAGIGIESATEIRISGNTIENNAGAGIGVESGSEIRISGNTIENNAGAGIFAHRAGRVKITDNTATGNLFGIQLRTTGQAAIVNNTLKDNSRSGIESRDDFLGTISHNTVSGNETGFFAAGLDDRRSRRLTLTENTFDANERWGVFLDADMSNLINNTITNTTGVPGDDESGDGLVWVGNDVTSIGDRIVNNAGNGVLYRAIDDRQILSSDPRNPTQIFDNGKFQAFNGSPFTAEDRGADGNIDARHVFWGTTDPAEVAAGIHDFFDDAARGIVHFPEPSSAAVLALASLGLTTRRRG